MASKLQENPEVDLSKRLAYEKLTSQYLNVIGKYYKDDYYYKRFQKASGAVARHKTKTPILLLGLL